MDQMLPVTTDPVAATPRRLGRRSTLSLVAGLGAVSALVSATAVTPVSAASGDDQAVVDVVSQMAPSVVTIQVTTGGQNASNGLSTPQMQGSGSGVIIDPNGLILTNRHVAGDATKVTVILSDGTQLDGKTVGVDTLTDFAFVKVDAKDLPAATLGDSNALRVGQTTIAMGNPLGEFAGTVTTGIVSGLDREIDVSDQMGQSSEHLRHLIQTDAAINPGNSGGPLVDAEGKVIGIDTAVAGDASGIGFALPIDLAKPIIEQVMAGKEIARPWIGIHYTDLDAQVAQDNQLSVTVGAWVHVDTQSGDSPIVKDSPAAASDLKDGDIITGLDGTAIDAQHQLDLLLLQHNPGDTVTLNVLRGGSTVDVPVTLGTRPATV
jgi:serine protease Do